MIPADTAALQVKDPAVGSELTKAALPLPITSAVTGLPPACCFAALMAQFPGNLFHSSLSYETHAFSSPKSAPKNTKKIRPERHRCPPKDLLYIQSFQGHMFLVLLKAKTSVFNFKF